MERIKLPKEDKDELLNEVKKDIEKDMYGALYVSNNVSLGFGTKLDQMTCLSALVAYTCKALNVPRKKLDEMLDMAFKGLKEIDKEEDKEEKDDLDEVLDLLKQLVEKM